MPTTVISVRGQDRAALQADPSFCYIGRQCAGWPKSIWGNPFKVRRYRPDQHKWPFAPEGDVCKSAEEALERYREWVLHYIRTWPAVYNLDLLRGKKLGCWCSCWPENPTLQCHGVVLAKLCDEGVSP